MQNGRWLSALILLTGLGSPALAEPVGTASHVDPATRSLYENVDGPMLIGDDIFKGQIITTSELGQVQILFHEGTKLTIGPRSRLEVEDFLMRNDGSLQTFTVNALKGTFRFVTGDGPKQSYRINTPSGQIGVRGTAFDFFVDENGHVILLLYEGVAQLCDLSGECVEVQSRCDLGFMTDEEARALGSSLDLGRKDVGVLRLSLPYAVSQLPLNRPFRVDNSRKCLAMSGRANLPGMLTSPEQGGDPMIMPPPPPPAPPPPEPERSVEPAGCGQNCIVSPPALLLQGAG